MQARILVTVSATHSDGIPRKGLKLSWKELLFQATPLLYTFSKLFQVCFEVSTQSAGERRRGGGDFGQPGTGATPLAPVASL